jgi:hypothetical protein
MIEDTQEAQAFRSHKEARVALEYGARLYSALRWGSELRGGCGQVAITVVADNAESLVLILLHFRQDHGGVVFDKNSGSYQQLKTWIVNSGHKLVPGSTLLLGDIVIFARYLPAGLIAIEQDCEEVLAAIEAHSKGQN